MNVEQAQNFAAFTAQTVGVFFLFLMAVGIVFEWRDGRREKKKCP
jgi:hypothetical protein